VRNPGSARFGRYALYAKVLDLPPVDQTLLLQIQHTLGVHRLEKKHRALEIPEDAKSGLTGVARHHRSRGSGFLAFGLAYLLFGFWLWLWARLAFGFWAFGALAFWRLAFWRLAFGFWVWAFERLRFGVWRLAFGVCRI